MSKPVPSPDSTRLSALGDDPGSILRVVEYFDGFDESAANADTVVRAAALLAECPVGAVWPSSPPIRYDAAGRLRPGAAPPCTKEPLGSDPVVWLERPDAAHPLDEVLLDRLRHCLRVLAARVSTAVPLTLGDPALLEVVLSGRARREERARALRLLGVDQSREVRVLAVSGPSAAAAVQIIGERLPVSRSAVIGGTTAVLVQDTAGERELSDSLNFAVAQAFPAVQSETVGPWVGIGERVPAPAAAASWEQALRALRFASSTWHGRRVIAFSRLGSLELLADMPVARLLGNAEVARVNEFASTEAGALAVDTLEAFCFYGSLRRTATELHLHHSTVGARIAQVEAVMGWDVDDAVDRFMATLVLTVRRIALSSAQLSQNRNPTDGG